jgi:hypothetical protein
MSIMQTASTSAGPSAGAKSSATTVAVSVACDRVPTELLRKYSSPKPVRAVPRPAAAGFTAEELEAGRRQIARGECKTGEEILRELDGQGS